MIRHSSFRPFLLPVLCLALLASALPAGAQEDPPPIVQPGAPGEPSRVITPEQAADLAGILWTEADVQFMQGMIPHHAQALEMTALVGERTENADMRELAKRIELSQEDEIAMMQDWLRDRGQDAPEPGDGHGMHGMHGDHGGDLMPGMLTAEQMEELKAAAGVEFDRLFLERMISHHRGALVMVDDLLTQRGAAQESTIFGFTNDVVADQTAEIDRMGELLSSLSGDPRIGLAAGFRDAGQALWNLELVAAVPKPVGFYSPDAPEGVPVPPEQDDQAEEAEGASSEDEEADAASSGDEEEDESGEAAEGDQEEAEEEPGETAEDRSGNQAARRAAMASIFNFANSDLAFSGTSLFNGSFHGFHTYNVEDPANPRLIASVVCPGGQGDVSVVGNLLIMSVEQTRGRLDCGLQGVADPVSSERFRGVRIFDISDLSRPQQVAAVQTCRGSHTHTVVTGPDDDGMLYVYGSGTSQVRPGEELEGCTDARDDDDTALFSIDVIQIPVNAPENSRVISRPRIFADPDSGRIAGLWSGGRHGTGTQRTAETNQCHDITVYPDLDLAAGACSGNGILLDIADPVNPVRLDDVTDPGFAYWHSATFNNDGTKVIFTDEWGGGMRPRCRATDPRDWGADAIFDIVDRKLVFRGYYKLPAPQSENENCVAHNGSLIPVPGRDIMVQSWYQGGLSVFDFTDSSEPVEIAFFDRGPLNPEELIMAGHWSAYWYDGRIYATEIARGLDVLRLLPSEHLSANEIAAAESLTGDVFNPQQQRRIDWPRTPVVALALLDQLERDGGLDGDRIGAWRAAVGDPGADTLRQLASDAREAAEGADAVAASRLDLLADTLEGIAASR